MGPCSVTIPALTAEITERKNNEKKYRISGAVANARESMTVIISSLFVVISQMFCWNGCCVVTRCCFWMDRAGNFTRWPSAPIWPASGPTLSCFVPLAALVNYPRSRIFLLSPFHLLHPRNFVQHVPIGTSIWQRQFWKTWRIRKKSVCVNNNKRFSVHSTKTIRCRNQMARN